MGVVGKIENFPNGVNVIPQQTDITIELRSPNDTSRLAARKVLLADIERLMAQYNLGYEHKLIYEQAAVTCSEALSSVLAQATASAGIEPMHLFSGAGHDGLAVTHLTDIAMLFMRCKNGVSHHPDEAITQADLLSALEVLQQFCLQLKGDSASR